MKSEEKNLSFVAEKALGWVKVFVKILWD